MSGQRCGREVLSGRRVAHVSRCAGRDEYSLPVLRAGRWRRLAACRDVDPELFFPVTESDADRVAGSKAVCRRCPVRAECLAEAVGRGEVDGTWGGVPEWDRDRLRTGSPVSRRPGAANVADRCHADLPSAAEYQAAVSAVVVDDSAPGGYVDEVAVEVAASGSRPVRLTESERVAAVVLMLSRDPDLTVHQISARLRCGITTARALVATVRTPQAGSDVAEVPGGDPVAVA